MDGQAVIKGRTLMLKQSTRGLMQKVIPSTARLHLLILAIGLCAVRQTEIANRRQQFGEMRGHIRGCERMRTVLTSA